MRLPRLLLIAFALLTLGAQVTHAQTGFSLDESPLPKPSSPVVDNAGVMDPASKRRIEDRIIQFRDRTNPQVELAVAIVKTTGNRPIFDYSLAVARGWGIGSKEDDNPGALLFIAIEDRKYFTQVSRNLEDELPDGLVGSLQRQFLVPQFKQGNYSKGVEDTINAYIRTIEARSDGTPIPATTDEGFRGYDDGADYAATNICGIIVCGLIVFIFIAAIIGMSGGKSRPSKKDRDRWGGGGFGGSGGGGGGADIAIDILGAVLGGIAAGASSGGSSSSSSGWDWGSGGGSGGGSWGGFGGGVDFGGGGAGGSW